MAKISICIPIHDSPKSAFFISRLMKSIDQQNYSDYEICFAKAGGMARTHNVAMLRGHGEIIKVMQMDDYFAHPGALGEIERSFDQDPTRAWLISGCLHDQDGKVGSPHYPRWSDDIYTGNNTLGGISTLAMRRENLMLFEEPLQWTVDCDLYYRMFLKYHQPILLNTMNVVVDVRTDRLTHTLSDELKRQEINYLIKKYV